MSRSLVLFILLATLRAARADDASDDADTLVAKGEELGRQGEWTQAVSAFKHADALARRTRHACMIALAYTRRELWAQAELYFARCHERAKTGDALPDWVADAEQQLAAKIAGANVPPITIAVAPAGTNASIAVSGFEADEALVPGVIHLPAGHYTIRVTSPGYIGAERELDVVAGVPQHVSFTLLGTTKPNPARDTRLPLYVASAGAALVVAGTVVDLVEVQPLRDQLAKSQYEYDTRSPEFSKWRTMTVGLWAAGALVVGVSGWLELRRRSLPMRISTTVEHGGASVSLEWSR